jgi:Trk-type K+ transport system membrane component
MMPVAARGRRDERAGAGAGTGARDWASASADGPSSVASFLWGTVTSSIAGLRGGREVDIELPSRARAASPSAPAAASPAAAPATPDSPLPPSSSLLLARLHSLRAWAASHARLNFFRAHLLYFVVVGHVGAVALYLLEGPSRLPFVDALYTSFSALCVTGLLATDTQALTVASQVVLVLLILAGGVVLASAVPVIMRRRYVARTVLAAVKGDAAECARILKEESTEYRALGWVLAIVTTYWVGVQLLVFLVLTVAVLTDAPVSLGLAARGINPYWWSFFHSVSSFGNAGFSLYSENLMAVPDKAALLLPLSLCILLGNTFFPVAVRFLVWACHRLWPQDDALKLLLDRPRRLFSYLFTGQQTRVLATTLVALTIFEFVLFLALDFNKPFLAPFSAHIRALMGWFQTVATRHAGFNVFDISQTNPAMQVLYVWLMYLTAFPIFFAIRRSMDEHHREEAERHMRKEAKMLAERDAEADAALAAEVELGHISPLAMVAGGDVTGADVAPPTARSMDDVAGVDVVGGEGEETRGDAAGAQAERRMTYRRSDSRSDITGLSGRRSAGGSRSGSSGPRGSPAPSIADRYAAAAARRHSNAGSSVIGIGEDDTTVFGGADGDSVELDPAGDGGDGTSTVVLRQRSGEGGRTTVLGDGDGGDAAASQALLGAAKDGNGRHSSSLASSVSGQARALLFRDLPLLFAALLLITIADSATIEGDAEKRITVWSILFDIVSAFGNVGVSLGYPNSVLSLSAFLTPFSKVVLVGVMLAGRHRGLPSSVDPAVFVPALASKTTVTAGLGGGGGGAGMVGTAAAVAVGAATPVVTVSVLRRAKSVE